MIYFENVSALLRLDNPPSAEACGIEPGSGAGKGADAGWTNVYLRTCE